MKIHGIGGLYL